MPELRRALVGLAATCLVVATLWVPSSARAASVLNVPGDYPTIQAAIDAASRGDTVLVAPGTYFERIRIYEKEITVESSAGPEATVIDGSVGGMVALVFALPGESPVLRGFTLTNGSSFGDAGGVVAAGGPAIIEDNIITHNYWGGVRISFAATILRHNVITDNWNGSMGGGVLVIGDGTAQVLGNTISGNTAPSYMGGGIDLYSAGAAVVAGNRIVGNSATRGGGIHAGNATDARIYNNLIAGNSSVWGGGIGYEARAGQVTNNTIVGNSGRDGSAISASILSGALSFANNIVVGDTETPLVWCGPYGDPLDPPLFANNDFVNRTGARFGGTCGDPTGTDGNLSVEPEFVDESAGDYHLQQGSPVIDVGRNDGAPSGDFDGDFRPFDGNGDGTPVVDIGFDEWANLLPEGTHDGSTLSVANDEYCYANGWAMDPDQVSAQLMVRILADDAQVWSGRADQFRQDLLDAGKGDGNKSFWVNLVGLITPDVPHVIRVQAQDADTQAWVDLDQTPRTITCLSVNTPPTGTHEAVAGATHSACLAAGWAADPDNWAHVLVRISSDGVVIWAGPANEFRQDLLDAEIGDGTYGFQVDIGSLISSDVPHVIRVEAQDANSLQWSVIDWTPLTITCTEIFGTHEGSQGIASKAECRATGWAADLDTPTGPRVQVRIKVDGRVVAETTANQFRPDVLEAGFGDGYSGFNVNLYGRVTPDRAHVVTVEARDTTAKKIWVPLDWTPLELTCSSH